MAEEQKRTRKPAALTHRSVETLKPEADAYRVPDLRCRGLGVRIAPGGGRTWDLAFRIRGTGKVRRHSLGPFPAVSLDAARERAGNILREAKNGRDLLVDEKKARGIEEQRITVAALIERYLKRKVRGKLRTAAEIEMRLKRALASIASEHADEIKRRQLREILDAVAERGVLREAEKQRQQIFSFFKWAVGQDLVENNPAAGLEAFSTGARRERALSDDEVGELWHWLPTVLPADYAAALRLQLALGTRIGEAAGIRVDEIDQATWIWTLPVARSKNKRPRATPLVGLALEIVRAKLKTITKGPLFITEQGLPLTSSHVASILVKRRKRVPIAHFVSHDLRRTVATGMVDLGISFETVAAVLGHEVGGASVRILARHYVRSDFLERKRTALDAWDGKLRSIIAGDVAPANVHKIADARRAAPI